MKMVLALMRLGFEYKEAMHMPEDVALAWIKASLPKTKSGKKYLVRKKK